MFKITTSVLILVLTSLLSACNDSQESSKPMVTNTPATDGGNVRPDSPDITTICYAGNESDVDAAIELTIDKNNITGYYALQPHEKDGAYGKLLGTMDSGRITAEYTHIIEGDKQTSEVAFALKGNTMAVGTGELVEKEGKLVFKNPSEIKWDNTFEETDCNKVSELIGYARDAVK